MLSASIFDNDVVFTLRNALESDEWRYTYEAFQKVYETKDMFFFYLAKNQAHLLPKSSFGGETVEKVREILQNKLGGRFASPYATRQVSSR